MHMHSSHPKRRLTRSPCASAGGGDGEGSEAAGSATRPQPSETIKVGTLVINFYDARTEQLIWRGSAQDMLSGKAAQNEKNPDKGVAKMFKTFPPEPAKG
jgi:hypothetical protein